MKSNKIIFCIIFATIFLFIATYNIDFHLKKTTQTLGMQIIKIHTELNYKNWTSIKTTFNSMKNDWENKKNILLLIIDHSYIDNIELSIIKLENYINQKNLEKSYIYLETLKHCLTNIYESEKLSIKNIL